MRSEYHNARGRVDPPPEKCAPARGSLLDLVTNDRLEFQFNPGSFDLALGAEWHSDTPQAASHPARSYRGGKGRSHTLKLVFLRRTVDPGAIEVGTRLRIPSRARIELVVFG